MTRTKEIAAAFAPKPGKSVTITLTEPITRDSGNTIEELTLRKPTAGELRGLKVPDLVQGDVNTVITVLPRITTPVISTAEAEAMDLEDFGEVAGAIYGFFMNQTARDKIAEMMGA